jgi:dihydroorotase
MSARNSNFLLTGLTLPDGTESDLQLGNGVITAIGKTLPKNSDDQVVDLQGSVVLPGLVDLHTHLREPGKEDAETVLSGSMAAAKGGFVAISAMANTSPVADTAGVVGAERRFCRCISNRCGHAGFKWPSAL